MQWLLNGQVGFALVDLAFVSALVAAVSFFTALSNNGLGDNHRRWQRLGSIAFVVHSVAVVGVFALLIGLIFTNQYQYHYVWSHSSNELPTHFIIACLWEGQEGSFLIWMVWHALIGCVLLRTAGSWRAGVLGTMATVQAILASMVLGVFVNGMVLMAVLVLALLALGYIWYNNRPQLDKRLFAGLGLLLGAALLAVLFVPLSGVKIGSSPFVLLRDALPNEAVFKDNPNFVPSNGNGLNPLLQNYWMVIHPPTLFLGFALTVVPFAFAVTALLQNKYNTFLKPLSPWLLLSVMVLGVGIIMGGYWAYETLNFGGYWNWDPVENASLVPWLVGVAALHVAMSYRHGKTNLRLALALMIAAFLLVLYSTFLTRSGVLGEASVHSFTDLGLSGQLLLLLLAYVVAVVVLLGARWPAIPAVKKESGFWSRETFLFLAALVLVFAALQISIVTSLPVFNKIFGTRLAPPGQLQLFYYKWNVWFGIGVALLSAIGQFVFWTKMQKEAFQRALFYPFATAALAAIAVMLSLYFSHWEFAYAKPFRLAFDAARESGNILKATTGAIGYIVLSLADEILLFCALFTVFANINILFGLVRRTRSNLARIGGSLAHVGFGLMLLGILFSSGYESTVSLNLTPTELGPAFPEEGRGDNVLLIRHRSKIVPGYRITYRGKRKAEAPIADLKVIFQDEHLTKVSFADATGERFGVELPAVFFQAANFSKVPGATGMPAPAEMDVDRLAKFINSNLGLIQPKLLNKRTLYKLEFQSLQDSQRVFTLYPEAEVNDRMGLVAHPSRKIYWDKDLYVHVTSIPVQEADTAQRKFKLYEERLSPGDTVHIGGGNLGAATIVLEKVVQVKDVPEFAQFDLVARARLKVLASGLVYEAAPTLLIKGNQPGFIDAQLEEVGLRFSFSGVDAKAQKIVLQVAQEIQPDDYITLKAIAKPYINLLWLGTFVLTAGFLVAVFRRVRENRSNLPQDE
jgi:cytochrome c-type biogenesis protein CcmF